jgi:hypothetical protein
MINIFEDLEMRVFLAHLVAYVVIVALLAAINLWLTPGYPWFLWVLIGWGAVVATHAFALILRRTRRRERIFIDKKTRSFAVHLFAYLATVLILFFVNVTVTPEVWWFYWVALGWGAGLIAHGWCAFGKRRRMPTATGGPAEPVARQAAHGATAKAKAKPSPKPRKPRSKSPKS